MTTTETVYDSPAWRENQKLGAQRRSQNPNWRSNQKLGAQQANSKQISCNGVIYESRRAAAIALAPENFKQKENWLYKQMVKYPEKYFYTNKQ